MKYIVIAISLLATLSLKAQENYQDNKLPVFKQVTHPFMPPITAAYFFFSEDGLLWFSTARGLTSFDGSEVTYYSSLEEANRFALHRIISITEDKAHNFYLGTPTGLYYYERRTGLFTNLTYINSDDHKPSKIYLGTLYCDNQGLIYAGSVTNGLFVYDPLRKRMDHFNIDASRPDSWLDLRLNTVMSFAKHSTDSSKLWVGTFHGIYLFDKKKKTFERRFEVTNLGHYKYGSALLEHYDIQKMDVENDSIIWFNSWVGGFGKYNTHSGKVKLFLHDARLKTPERYIGYNIPKFARFSPGKYLLGIYDYKTALFDGKTEKVQYFTVTDKKYSYSREETTYVTNDREGNVWLMQRGLIFTAVPDPIRLHTVTITTNSKIHFPQLRGIYFDKKTNLFYGAFMYAEAVYVFDTNFHLVKSIPIPILNNGYTYNTGIAQKITKDGNGNFWTAGAESYTLPSGGQRFLPLEKVFPSLNWTKSKNEFSDVKTTKKGDLLYKDNNGVIYHIRYNTLQTDTIRPPVIKAEGVEIKGSSQWYDAERNYIYLVGESGIARHSLDNSQTIILPYQSLFGKLSSNLRDCVFALDGGGRIWFMIPQYGIRIINPETLNCVDSIPYGSRGLSRGGYTSMIGAEKTFMLLRSSNGVVVYDYAKQQSYLFDHDNGLSSPDNQLLLYSNGHMLLTEQGDFEYFKLSNLQKYSMALTPRLNTILADTSLVFLNSGDNSVSVTRLPHYQNSISLSFSAKEFLFPERIEYAYQLTPLDKDWHYTNYFNRKINYTRLGPGKYIFRLKAQMQGSNWTAIPVEYVIIIKPAWWQTNLFKIGCTIIVAGLLFYFSRKRIESIRKKEQQKALHEKELLELEAKALRAQMNPHFIFNCLNSIKSLIQQHEEEKSVTYLTTFSKLIRTLFNNADKKEISLYDEIETCKLYLQLEAMRFDTKFSYSVNIDDNMDLKSIQVPALIIQPFIENAIWHGIVPRNTGGHVSMNVLPKDDIIEIIIDDDGIGREASQQNKSASSLAHQSKGVNLTQSRLELNNMLQQRQAKLETIDKKDENGSVAGTKVIITLKEEI